MVKSKHLTPLEATHWHAAKMRILPIFERDPTFSAYFTADAGAQDARTITQAYGQLAIPTHVPLVITVDCDASYLDIVSYLHSFNKTVRGVIRSIRPIWLYAGGRVIKQAYTTFQINAGWQAASPGWQGFDTCLSICPVRQYTDDGVTPFGGDLDEATQAGYSQMW